MRLGHDRSVETPVCRCDLLKPGKPRKRERQIRGRARNTAKAPVVASTTATWSSEKYSPAIFKCAAGRTGEGQGLQFDVAIIDEAGQLTIPAMLGALRLARRFILVGDEKQLPPLVLSKEAAAGRDIGLALQ